MPEVRDEAIGRPTLDKPRTDLVECFAGLGLESQVIEAAASEHRDLASVLDVVRQFEDIELRRWSNPHEGER